MAPAKRSTYHHGDLRAALIQAADALIARNGIEGFSLRRAAAAAGVSPGAPAHHFGSAAGLLTEVAILTYRDIAERVAAIPLGPTPAAELRALATAYVIYALDHPGRFRLINRQDLVNEDDPKLDAIAITAFFRFFDAAARFHGLDMPAPDRPDLFAPQILLAVAMVRGIADMAVEGTWSFALASADPQRDFLDRLLPTLLGAHWPDPT